MRLARGRGGVGESIAGRLMMVVWQQHHKRLSASHWQPGTCGAGDALRLDCSKSLPEVQIRIPGSWGGHGHAGSNSQMAMGRRVGRVTPCAPFARRRPRTGAHGVTRPTNLTK